MIFGEPCRTLASTWCSFALASGGSPRGRPTPLLSGSSRRDILPPMTTDPDPDVQCSAKGCRQPAVWRLLWRNPRIHTVDRTKQWLACEEHRGPLSDFLARRDFPLTVEKL